MKKYFVSYSHSGGFGELVIDTDEITKENAGEWLNHMTKYIKEKIKVEQVIVINFKEIK